jgi:hypothetical protein
MPPVPAGEAAPPRRLDPLDRGWWKWSHTESERFHRRTRGASGECAERTRESSDGCRPSHWGRHTIQNLREEFLATATEPQGNADFHRRTGAAALLRLAFPPAETHEPLIGFEIAWDNAPRRTTVGEPTNSSMQYQKRTASIFEERTDMQNKWLNLGNRRQQQDGANGGNHGSQGMNGDATATTRGDLLLLEDIYRTAGIMEPRMGYSITKVAEMLRSDHLRGLGDEVKRASVLMALNAAGIPLSDILQDAAHRQAAVAAYEVEQRNKFEEYWSRRAEENSQLQVEMERVTRQYVEKMNRNLTEVQQEKEAFQKWQNGLQYEVLQISEAVTLCAQPAMFEQAAPERPAAAGSPSGQNLVAKSA